MRWTTPCIVEVNMDAEIGGYQDDFGDPPDVLSHHAFLVAVEPSLTNVPPIQAT